MEGHEHRWQPVAGDGLAGMDGQGAPRQAAHFRQHQFGAAHAGQNGLGLRQKGATLGRQFDAPADAVKKLHPVKGLEVADRSTDGGRRQRDRIGGTGQVLAFGDSNKNLQLFEGQGMAFAFHSVLANETYFIMRWNTISDHEIF
ncbi:hypothetical protein D3C87_1737250 [compost metagenome]